MSNLKKFMPYGFSKLSMISITLAKVITVSAAVQPTYLNVVDTPRTWDFSPSWMADTVSGTDRIWWCSDRAYENEPPSQSDVIRYAEGSSAATTSLYVLEPTPSGIKSASPVDYFYDTWEGFGNCDPAVVRGNFSYKPDDATSAQTYSHAMYYTAAKDNAYNNKISVAFSNDGKNWVRFGNAIANIEGIDPSGAHAPSIGLNGTKTNYLFGSDFPSGATIYGAGQAQVRNYNGGSGIQMWYTDTPKANVTQVFERSSPDGINFGVANAISNKTSDYPNGINIAGFGMALSPNAPYYLYLAAGVNLHSIHVYRLPYDQRFSGVWQLVDTIEATQSIPNIFEVGFRTDIYGNLSPSTYPSIFLGFGCSPKSDYSDTSSWRLCQAAITDTIPRN